MMRGVDKRITAEDEVRRLTELFGEENPRLFVEMLERQFTILHTRAQVLLGLAGVVITTTGFSGRLIAGTSALAQGLVIAGVALVLVAATLVAAKVLPIRWLTHIPGDDYRAWMLNVVRYRDMKTRAYQLSIWLLIAGLGFYVGAVGLMLVAPRAFDLGVGR
jgi:hypothetical protein